MRDVEVVDETPIRLLQIGSMKRPALTTQQQEQLQSVLYQIRNSPGPISEVLLRKALVLFAGNESQLANAIGVSRQRISQLVQEHKINVRELQASAHSRHMTNWKIQLSLLAEMPDVLRDDVQRAFVKEADHFLTLAIRTSLKRPHQRTVGLNEQTVTDALRLHGGSLCGAALDLGVSQPTVLYWIEKIPGLREKVDAWLSVQKVRIPWPVPDLYVEHVKRVVACVSIGQSSAFARIMRGTLRRLASERAHEDQDPPTLREPPKGRSASRKVRPSRGVQPTSRSHG